MLVAGVLLGIIAGPTVLGNVSPQLYDAMFVGSGDTTELDQTLADLEAFKSKADEQQAEIDAIFKQAKFLEPGDSPHQSAMQQIDEKVQGFKEQEEALKTAIESARIPIGLNQQVYRDKLSGVATVVVLLVVLLLAAESILSPHRDEIEDGQAELSPVLSRLVTIRYGLIAGWLILMLAQPVWLQGIKEVLPFGVLLLLVVLVAGLVPLGKSARS